ncbi:MAG: hypothetical protein GF317_18095 [Candidatus Lokiarchaeota archaeon]|nr:hypothetical protein [Candidatus Lokiarchaeota archaeon]MBD3201425.1 hypothetical protein [Candidatus Lokiarchaeota archaeon]
MPRFSILLDKNDEEDNNNNFNAKEARLLNLAQKAWGISLKEFYYPPLNEPHYVFDYTHKEGFYIDPNHKWQITMNLANTPLFREDMEYIDFFNSIMMHEIGHYQIIPYDGLTNANLLKAAMKYVNQNFASVVVNLFSDLIIDKTLYKKYPKLVSWELKSLYTHLTENGNLSEFSKMLFSLYECILDIKIDVDGIFFSDSGLIERISNTVLKNFYDETKWEKKVSKIAYYLRDLINDTFTIIGKGVKCKKGNSRRKSAERGGHDIEVPDDVLEIMDNPLENRNSDKLKENNQDDLRSKAEEFAKNSHYSEFGAPASQAGILLDASPLRTWYRGKAKDLIEIKVLEEKPRGELPIYPEVWRIGDPIEELDIVQTLLNSPVIIPNITTRKWAYKLGIGKLEEKEIPDLLIVLDSSGSMGWNYNAHSEKAKGPYHTALIAAFASLYYAAKKGVKFSVINFSNKADICTWTNNYEEAESTLLHYQGGGTVLPMKEIQKQCENSDKKVLVFIITDFGIYNWSSAKKSMLNLIQKGHKLVGFFIGSSKIPKSKFGELLNKVTFYPIKNTRDLINLVIEEVKKFYDSLII